MTCSLSTQRQRSVAAKALESHVSAIRRNNELPPDLFDKIEAVIGDYCHFRGIRHGENVVIAGVKTSWHFNNDHVEEDAHVTVCFKQGHEWVDDCYVDEVPPSFLVYILETITQECRLWDPRPAEIEAQARQHVLAMEVEQSARERPKICLNVLPHNEHWHAGGRK